MKTIIKTLFALVVAAAVSVTAFAQNQNQNLSLINVQGEGKVFVLPDQLVLSLSVNSKAMSYNEVVNDLNKQVAEIIEMLEKAGFDEEEIKTSRYSINVNRYWDGERQREEGYIGTQQLRVEFPFDQRQLQKVMAQLAKSPVPAEFSFAFTISDEKMAELKTQLMELAVADARAKAQTLAGAANVTLGSIHRIEYQPVSVPQPYYDQVMMKQEQAESFAGFNADEIVLRETVMISWVIQ